MVPSAATRSTAGQAAGPAPVVSRHRGGDQGAIPATPANSPFDFTFEGTPIHILGDAKDPKWVLADVCRVLEVGNTADAARRLDDDEKGVDTIDTPGGSQQTTVINESGLYSLILTSRKPAAKRFKKWVTGTVLPAGHRVAHATPLRSHRH